MTLRWDQNLILKIYTGIKWAWNSYFPNVDDKTSFSLSFKLAFIVVVTIVITIHQLFQILCNKYSTSTLVLVLPVAWIESCLSKCFVELSLQSQFGKWLAISILDCLQKRVFWSLQLTRYACLNLQIPKGKRCSMTERTEYEQTQCSNNSNTTHLSPNHQQFAKWKWEGTNVMEIWADGSPPPPKLC